MNPPASVRNVSDTAHWVALYRALESERPDAHFHDAHARRLAGTRGEQIHATLPGPMRNAAWSVVARTVVMDRMIQAEISAGVTLVVNLAAGLDTRPYRLPLPPNLVWVEVDQGPLLAEKAALLESAEPHCTLERIPLDLSQEAPVRELLQRLGQRAEKVLVITEGLVMYLRPEEVATLARTMAGVPTIQGWVTDVISPGLLRMIEKDWGHALRAGSASMHFAPAEGVAWFESRGWRVAECQSTFVAAKALRRLPWFLQLLSYLPGGDNFHPDRPWSGICLLTPILRGDDAGPGGGAQ
jgi:methyltransferase (TIGR00027 family)